MTAEDQAFHLGQAWEALPEPKRQFNYYVIGNTGETKVFYIGPHAPSLSPEDIQLVHRLWLNMRRDPSAQTPAGVHLGGQDLTELPAAPAAPGRELPPPKPPRYL